MDCNQKEVKKSNLGEMANPLINKDLVGLRTHALHAFRGVGYLVLESVGSN